MDDCRTELLKSIEILMAPLESETASYVMDVITVKLENYEVTKRTTDMIVYDDQNERLVKQYTASLLVEGKAKSSIKGYRWSIKKLADETGKNLLEITTYDIRTWLAKMKIKGIKNSTISNQRNNIAAFYKWLSTEEMIDKNPCDRIKPIKKPKEKKLPFTDEDIDAMRSKCNTRERAILETLLSSGVRVDELCNLAINDVDFERLTVRVRHGKGDKERETYITPVAKKYLKQYLESRKDELPYLFVSGRGQFTVSGIEKMLKRVGERSGVENVYPHRFRRTLATILAKRGMPIQEIQRVLGHSDIGTTQIYIDTENNSVQASYRQYVA